MTTIRSLFAGCPIIYLLIGFGLLWFPVETVMSFSYMRQMGRYVNDVLSPKLAAISESPENETRYGREYRRWQEANISSDLRGQLRWEAYLKETKPYAYPYFGLSVFSAIRFLILFWPTFSTIALYAAARLNAATPAWWVLLAEGSILAGITFAFVVALIRTIGTR
ncbi:hypothetical protein [Nonomuraea sp. NPDC050202]|uniref:hypothetical protein n=1 Tax=Nonomuraea sp. NPDC050202 TaxID=3155035 RepID=UPI0033C51DD8